MAVVASIDAPGEPCRAPRGSRSAPSGPAGRDLLRLDLDAGAVTATVAADEAPIPGTPAAGPDRLRVLTGDGSRLVGIDPGTDAVDPPAELGVRGTDLAVDEGAVWAGGPAR